MTEFDFRDGGTTRGESPVTSPEADKGLGAVIDRDSTQSVLEDLKESLSAAVEVQPVTLRIPNRQDIDMIFTPAVEYDDLRAWIKAASPKNQFDQLRLAYIVVSNFNSGVLLKGTQVFDEEGTPLTVRHAQLKKMMGTDDTKKAIFELYGGKAGEGHLIAVSAKLMDAAGYGDIDGEGGLDPLPR